MSANAIVNTETLGRLYQSLMKSAVRFPVPRLASFFLRRTNEKFSGFAGIKDEKKMGDLYDSGIRDLAAIRRQSVVYRLYDQGTDETFSELDRIEDKKKASCSGSCSSCN